MPAVKFDWLDQDTWRIPFDYQFVNDQVISAIYLMEPQAPEPWKPLNEFIDYALETHGVRRFVLVAGSSAECGKPGMGMVWQHFLDRQVDHCVLRPSWFMGEQPKTLSNILEEIVLMLLAREHVKLSGEERYRGLLNAGVSEYYAGFLTRLEVAASTGFETRENDQVEKVTGRPPRCFDLFAQENRSAWVPEGNDHFLLAGCNCAV